jgi:hypothetical protein
MYDLFFLSHNEPFADIHWRALSKDHPHAKYVDGIDGILAAHRHCAVQARTTNFFVVDADNEILDVDFKIKLADYDREFVHVWRARNLVNGLVYGWGGVKLFPRKLLLAREDMALDMTTSFPMKIMPVIGSVTHFNTSPFNTWRSAFREAVKLVLNDDQDSRERLETWCTVAHGPFSLWCLRGACMGRDYGAVHKDDMAMLLNINDWTWLRNLFESVSTE